MKSLLIVDMGLPSESLNSHEILAWGLAVFSVHIRVFAVPANNVAEVSVVSPSWSALIVSVGVPGSTGTTEWENIVELINSIKKQLYFSSRK